MTTNILSLRCSLAFAPYLAVTLAEFLTEGAITSQVVRQGGGGLILRSDGDLLLRHEQRQAALGREEARHYATTVRMRCEFYDVLRMQDEVALATAGDELLLSYPQSEMWLTRETIAALVGIFCRDTSAEAQAALYSFPEWLKVSSGGGRLLLSDQRTARWVLLGEDHVRELERRLALLRQAARVAAHAPPTIQLKGLDVHLQSALRLAQTLDELAETGRVTPFEEITPTYSLKASGSTEGLELSDSSTRVALTAREARKWAAIIRSELDRLNVRCVERGGIRTVFAEDEHGRWILQWGDEVLVPQGSWSGVSSSGGTLDDPTRYLVTSQIDPFLSLLNPATGACVALTDTETKHLADLGESVDSSEPNEAV